MSEQAFDLAERNRRLVQRAERGCYPLSEGRGIYDDNERVHLLWMKIIAYEGPARTGKTTKLIQSLEGLLAREPLRDG